MPVVRLTFKGNGGSGAGASWYTFWWETDDGTPDDCQDLAENQRNLLETHMDANLVNAWYMGRLDSKWYPSIGMMALPSQVHNVPDLYGNDVSEALAPRQTMLITFKAFATPPNEKRCYIGRYGEARNAQPGVPDGQLIAALQSYANAMLLPRSINAHTYTPIVARTQPSPDAVIATNPLTSYVINTKWAFLRSRDLGHGV